MLKHLAANAMTVLIVGLFAVAGVALWGVQQWTAEGPLEAPQRFVVESGATLTRASEALEAEGVIDSAAIFRIGARYRDAADRLKAGEYEIPAAASMEEVLDVLVTGRAIEYRITVAEGRTVWEVAEFLKGNPLMTGEISELPPEGSLAPETYFYGRETDRNVILKRMADAQAKILDEAWANRAPNLPLNSKEEALVLASIVEKETGVDGERTEVAGVFINRLRLGMRLQSDPTIIYGITKGQGPLGRGIRRSEITAPTPWNTYVIDRLPPTPIANPGRAAIEATLNPAETEFLYFVADGTGGHVFAKTLREHQRNVAEWRKIEQQRQSQ